jgi:hypothetical protein
MAQPTSKQVHEDALLTNISIAYQQDPSVYIADKVFPFVASAKQSNKYRTYTKNDWFRDEMKILAPGAEAAVTGYGLSTDTFYCDVWALAHDVDEQVESNFDEPGDPYTDATALLTQLAMIRRERQWHSDYFGTGVWGTDVTGTTDFDKWTVATSNPKANIRTGYKTVLQNTGMMPNTLVVGYNVHDALVQHPLIRDQFKYTSSDSIDANMLARYFDIPRYMVSKAIYATNEEGATGAYSFVGGDHALLCYVNPTPSLRAPSAGYTIGWAGLTGLNGLATRMLRIPAPLRHATRIEIQMAFDLKKVAADVGYFFASAV